MCKQIVTAFIILMICVSCIRKRSTNIVKDNVTDTTMVINNELVNDENEEFISGSLEKKESMPTIIDKNLLQGVWAMSQEENALFYIKGESFVYVESQDTPYKIKLQNNILTVYADLEFHLEIIKLDQDSLCYIDDITEEITRLSRR